MAFKRQHPAIPFTPEEAQRLVELEFVYGLDHFFKVLDDREEAYDILDILCTISDIDPAIVRTAATNIRSVNSTIRGSKEELSVFLYRAGNDAHVISKIVELVPNTIYTYIRRYYTHSERPYLPHLKSTYHVPLKRFTQILRDLLNYDEFTIHR